MTETTVPEQKGETSFWSPWAVFFLGVPFAALNWWRMGNKRKAIGFMALSWLIAVFNSWMDVYEASTDTDRYIRSQTNILELIIVVSFSSVLALLVASDIKRFRKDEKSPVSVKWQIVFVFWLVLAASNFGTWAILDHVARQSGYCRFSRLQDIVYQRQFEQRSTLEMLLLSRRDFNCDWIWDIDRLVKISDHEYGAFLDAYSADARTSKLWVNEHIFVYDQIEVDDFSKIAEKRGTVDGDEFLVKVDDPYARFSNISCVTFSKFTVCQMTFGYDKVIADFEVTFVSLSEETIKSLVASIVSTNSTRIHEYEAELP